MPVYLGGDGSTAVLTGNGEIGEGTASMSIRIYDGGIVHPGRPNAVGMLTFVDQLVDFREGSKLRLDLDSPQEHDVLKFLNVHSPATVSLATNGAGVELELNFLGATPEVGEYTVLEGYSSLSGEFVGWADNVGRTLPGYANLEFRVNYNNNAVVLSITPGSGLMAASSGESYSTVGSGETLVPREASVEVGVGILQQGTPSFSTETSTHALQSGTPSFGAEISAFALHFEGIPGQTYLLEVSEDLVEWTSLAVLTADLDGRIVFTDPHAADFPRRFYRLVAEPTPPAGLEGLNDSDREEDQCFLCPGR